MYFKLLQVANTICATDYKITGIGIGVAIPHAKLEGYSDFFIAIGVQKKKGIDWNALDGSDVKLIFMIGGPENKQTEYLKILLVGLSLVGCF